MAVVDVGLACVKYSLQLYHCNVKCFCRKICLLPPSYRYVAQASQHHALAHDSNVLRVYGRKLHFMRLASSPV